MRNLPLLSTSEQPIQSKMVLILQRFQFSEVMKDLKLTVQYLGREFILGVVSL